MKLILPFFFSFCFSAMLGAATFTVTKTADTNDGTCDADCSLREAIAAANLAGGINTVVVPTGTYTLTLGSELLITSNMTIDGAGASTTIIEAAATQNTASWRVFHSSTSGTDVVFEDITIRHGVESEGAGVRFNQGNGSSGTATFTRVTVTNNNSTGGRAGVMIRDDVATLTMTDCTISANIGTNGTGGGIGQIGAQTANFTNCFFDSNGGVDDGGALLVNEGTNTFIGCSFQDNMAGAGTGDHGGAVQVGNGGTNVTFTNCTFTNNTTGADGGNGGAIDINNGTVSLNNCTIANNTAGTNGIGGGIYGVNGTLNMVNCILADNTDNTGANDIHFASTSMGTNTTNLVENCTSSGTCPTFSVTADPALSGKAVCTGTNKLVLPISGGSSAENAGTAGGSAPSDDMCGTVRSSPPDLGSFEIGSSFTLPVELIDFKVRLLKNQLVLAQLQWQTATEVNNLGFEIEWSLDSRTWSVLSFVSGAGDSFEKQSYQFTHNRPASGINYYRLKQIDFDGAFEYSNVVSVDMSNFENLTYLRIAPNPAQSGSFTLYLRENEAENIQMDMFDYTGRHVRHTDLTNLQTEINVADLDKGMYLVKVEMDGLVRWEQVVVQ